MTGSKQRLSLPLLQWIPDPIVLVEPQEFAAYQAEHPTLDIRKLPRNDRGFGYMLNQMVKLTLDEGKRYFVFTDDDVERLNYRKTLDKSAPDGSGYLRTVQSSRRPDREPARKVLTRLLREAARGRWAQLAVSFNGIWTATTEIQEPVGSWGVHVTDAIAVREVGGYNEKLPIFNDWEMSARLIEAGYRCGRTNLVSFCHVMRTYEGGAQVLYDKPRIVKAAAQQLADRWPEAARVVKAHGGLSEIRFSWKKFQRVYGQ